MRFWQTMSMVVLSFALMLLVLLLPLLLLLLLARLASWASLAHETQRSNARPSTNGNRHGSAQTVEHQWNIICSKSLSPALSCDSKCHISSPLAGCSRALALVRAIAKPI